MKLTEVIWDKSWELGIPNIDAQHRKLIGIVNDIAKSNISNTLEFIKSLIEYSADHFMDEEDLMISVNYNEVSQHKLEHRLFTRAILEYSFRMSNGEDKETLKEEVAEFVAKWFAYHFLKTDKKLAEFIRVGGGVIYK